MGYTGLLALYQNSFAVIANRLRTLKANDSTVSLLQ